MLLTVVLKKQTDKNGGCEMQKDQKLHLTCVDLPIVFFSFCLQLMHLLIYKSKRNPLSFSCPFEKIKLAFPQRHEQVYFFKEDCEDTLKSGPKSLKELGYITELHQLQ